MRHIEYKDGIVGIDGVFLKKFAGSGREKDVFEVPKRQDLLISVLNKIPEKELIGREHMLERFEDSENYFKASFYFRKILQLLFPGELSNEHLVTELTEDQDILSGKARIRIVKKELLGESHKNVAHWLKGWRDTPGETKYYDSILFLESLAEKSNLFQGLPELGVLLDKKEHNLTDTGVYLDTIPAFYFHQNSKSIKKNYDIDLLKQAINKLGSNKRKSALKKLNRVEFLYEKALKEV